MKITTRTMSQLALFLALGIVLPYITSHAFGIPGTIILPMHIPVILVGLIYGPFFGGFFGLVLPCISTLISGMPSPIFLPIMLVELCVYGIMSGLLYKKLKLNIYVSLIITMIMGRLIYAGFLFLLTGLFGLEQFASIASAWSATIVGLPGIILQIALIPVIIKYMEIYKSNEPNYKRQN